MSEPTQRIDLDLDSLEYEAPVKEPFRVNVEGMVVEIIDPATIASMTIRPYDGRNWETARSDLDPR